VAARRFGGGLRGLVGVIAVVVAPASAGAASLPAAPFAVEIGPSPLRAGQDAVVRLVPRGGPPPAEVVDVHLIRIPSGPPFLRYLWPTGVWSLTPAPYQRAAFVPRLGPLAATWREDGDPGWISVLVAFTRPGADPSDRRRWVFQPVMRRLMVRPAPDDPHRLPGLGWLAALTAAAAAAVTGVAVQVARSGSATPAGTGAPSPEPGRSSPR
jgi:hypothetical protein